MPNSKVLAIDFGTTNSYFCYCSTDEIRPVGIDISGVGRDGVSTAVLYREDKEPLVGDIALEEFGEMEPQKRKKSTLKIQFKPDISVSENARQSAQDFLSLILKTCDDNHIPLIPDHGQVIIGAPSEAKETFHNHLKSIASLAGYGDIKIVDEAKGALLYHLSHKDISLVECRSGVLVVDFGGGTCDFSFLHRLDVEHSWGDMNLGGRLFDDLFFQWFIEQNPAAIKNIEKNGDIYYFHSYKCREVKEFFSRTMNRDRNETISKNLGDYGRIRNMTWNDFCKRAANYKPSKTFLTYLKDAGITNSDLQINKSKIDLLSRFRSVLMKGFKEKSIDITTVNKVILAGGSSQWSFVSETLIELARI